MVQLLFCEDIVFMIMDIMKASTAKHLFLRDLRSLSLTSRYFRTICLPVLFRTVKKSWRVGMNTHKTILPKTLCHHVTTFELNVSAAGELGPPTELSDKLAEVLPYMFSLHTFRLVNSPWYGPWPALLQAIFSAPYLTTLEIIDSPWRRSSEIFTDEALELFKSVSVTSSSSASNLRRFVYRVPFTDCFPRTSSSHGRRDEVQGRVEILNLLALISQFNTVLEVLELPAEIAPFLLCNEELAYPNLRRLRIEGHVPLLLPRWRAIFSSAPQLRGVEFRVAKTRVEARYRLRPGSGCGEEGYCLLPPPSSTKTATNRSEHDHDDDMLALERSTLSRLKSLHLSSPCVQDGIFHHLSTSFSDNLTELCLVAYPLPGILGARWSDAPASELRTAKEMLDVLKVIALPGLVRFKVAYIVKAGDREGDVDADQQLVKRIGESFPELEELEMHRYRDPSLGPASEMDPLPMIKEGLAPLVNLSHLRLNLDYPHRPRYTRSRQSQSQNQNNVKAYRAFHEALEHGDARSIAEASNSLQSVGILFHEDFSTYWDMWGVERYLDAEGKRKVRLIGCPRAAVEV